MYRRKPTQEGDCKDAFAKASMAYWQMWLADFHNLPEIAKAPALITTTYRKKRFPPLSFLCRLRFWHCWFPCVGLGFLLRYDPANTHRVLQAHVQGAAQRGAQFYFIFAVLRTLLFMQRNGPFPLSTCIPMKATSEAPLKYNKREARGGLEWHHSGSKCPKSRA